MEHGEEKKHLGAVHHQSVIQCDCRDLQTVHTVLVKIGRVPLSHSANLD